MPAPDDTRQYKTFGQPVLKEPDSSWSRERVRVNIQQLLGTCSDSCLVAWHLCCSCWEHEAAMIRFIPSDLLSVDIIMQPFLPDIIKLLS